MEHERICSLAVTWDGTKIISGGGDRRMKVWDVESHKLVKEWTHLPCCDKIAISPDDRFFAVRASGREVDIYTMEGRQVGSVKISNYTLSVCFSPDGNKLACGTYDGIRMYDLENGTLILRLGGNMIDDVVWSHDGSKLFSPAEDNTIRCWNSDTGQQIGHPWTGHTQCAYSLSLSPDGSILASASWDKTVRFWNATTGDPIGQLQHDCEVEVVRFSPSGESVASAGVDGKIRFWRVPLLNWRVSTLTRCLTMHAHHSPPNRQSLLTPTPRATLWTARKCPSYPHLHHTPLVCTFLALNKRWVLILM